MAVDNAIPEGMTIDEQGRIRFFDEERRHEMFLLLDEARHYWEQLQYFRDARKRSRDYYRGRQWDELTQDPDDEDTMIREKDLIERQGRIAWVMNHVQAVVRNLKGQYRLNRSERAAFATAQHDAEALEMVNVGLRSTRRHNQIKIIETDQQEEFMISGACCFEVNIEWDASLNRNEVEVEVCDMTRMFWNPDVADRRLKGLKMIGRLHDYTMDELVYAYATNEDGTFNAEKADHLAEVYPSHRHTRTDFQTIFGFHHADAVDFYRTVDTEQLRVIELWVKEYQKLRYVHDPVTAQFLETDMTQAEIADENREREEIGLEALEFSERMEPVWVVYHLSPYGDVLFHGRSPFWHEGHPFVLGLATLFDGEVWGLVENIIDPQRWLNRVTSTIDFSLSSSAKGVLLVPEDAIPDGMDINDFAEEWTVANGVIKIVSKPGVEIPQQIATSAIPVGTFELLANLKQWIEETSGVTGPMQGFDPKSGTPAALYQQQVIQASTTTLDFQEGYLEVLQRLDRIILQAMLQGWNEPRSIAETARRPVVEYDPMRVRMLDWDVTLGDVADTATYRQLWEADLQRFLELQLIDFATYLEMSSHPKAQQLLKLIQQQDPSLGQMDIVEMQAALQAQAGQPGNVAPRPGTRQPVAA